MKIGDELGNFVIDAELGTGSFGVVYRGHNKMSVELRRAFKVLRADLRDDAESARLFLREAAILQLMDNPHVCKIFDVGQTADGRPYLSMELLEGETLAQRLARGALPASTVFDYVFQICDALAEVHRCNVVHRDLKPANLLIIKDAAAGERLKLFDFNIAKRARARVGTIGTTLSTPEAGPGTDRYMSPEQITDPEAVDRTSDIWALGVVLFEMAAGHPPFNGASSHAIRLAIVTGDRQPLPSTWEFLRPLIDRCLVARGKRFESIDEVRVAAMRLAEGSTRPMTGAPQPQLSSGLQTAASVRLRNWLARQWPAVTIAMFALGLTLGLGSFAAHPQLNDLRHGNKHVGYITSFNWTLVFTLLEPMAIAVLGVLLGRTAITVKRLGSAMTAEWDHRAPRLVATWAALSIVFAAGYTLVEWSPVLRGDCDAGTFLGWPNRLCDAVGWDRSRLAFLVIAALAQVTMLSVAWAWFAVTVWLGELCFGRAGPDSYDEAAADALDHLFRISSWGWTILLVAMYLARLHSFHRYMPETDGILETIVAGLPGSLLEVRLHTQSDIGSVLAGFVISMMMVAPFILLRARTAGTSGGRTPRRAAIFSGAGVIAMVFPRLGVFVLLAAAFTVAAWSRQLASRQAR